MREYTLICDHCQSEFSVSGMKWKNNRYAKRKTGKRHFCSEQCRYLGRGMNKRLSVKCKNCLKEFEKLFCEAEKSPNHFCSQSCAGTYNNTHKAHGTRRSKLEVWLEVKLIELFPSLEIHFNRKDAISSELDFYIPSLKLAFELNGIFHYEPIYGNEKLSQIQNNDCRKFQACLEKGIELCIIDSSKLTYFKPANAQKYLDIIVEIINRKLVSREVIETPSLG